jgi:GcrA cell cycle regulator
MVVNWTDERVELLKRLWGEGLSASQIARQLGGVTRNAVIGKVHRLKLSGRSKTVVTTNRSKKPGAGEEGAQRLRTATAAAGVQQARSRPLVVGNTALKPEMLLSGDAVAEMRVAQEPNILVMPTSRKLSLVQLSEKTCRWPIGDPMLADFNFCGNECRDASPYCAYHSRLAFQPASERKRLR